MILTSNNMKRYESYKDSCIEWVGEVPEHWEVMKLKHVASFNDEVLGDKTDDNLEIEYVEISNVHASMGLHTTEKMLFKDAPSRARRLVKHGDVIVSTVRTYLRAISKIENPPANMVVSTGFAVIRPKDIQYRFAGYLLISEYIIHEIIARSVGVSYPAINASELVNIKVILPPLKEQKAIGDFLDTKTAHIDTLIQKKQQLIALLEEEKTAVINEAVTKGLNPDAPMKDSGVEWLGMVPEHWEVKKLKWFAKTNSGSTPNSSRQEDYYNGDIPWIRTLDLNNNEVFQTELKITEKALAETSCKINPLNTVMVAMYGGEGTIGKSGISRLVASTNQAICCILPNDSFDSDYLHEYIKFYRPYWMIGAEGTRRDPNISQDDIKNLIVIFPPIEEQVKISIYIRNKTDKITETITYTKKEIELMQEYRTALISEAVTGKIDVRDYQLEPNLSTELV